MIHFPTIADYHTAKTSRLYKAMERHPFQMPTDYKWSGDPLHHWSRVWEYPWVYNQLRGQTVLDAGAGITFFPSFLRRFGHIVTTLDNDMYSASYMKGLYGHIETHIGQYDNVICISVIEHTRDPFSALENLRRCVKPGGRLILTVDVGLNGAQMDRVTFTRFAKSFGFTSFPNLMTGNHLTTRTVKEGLPGPTHLLKRFTSLILRHDQWGHIPYLTVCGLMEEL
jgi:2-polyprenyl-3-methyl-5-hydroxy-6-metoxy-1,4-benzoquinol methylase